MDIELVSFIAKENGERANDAVQDSRIKFTTPCESFNEYIERLQYCKPSEGHRKRVPIETRFKDGDFKQIFLMNDGRYMAYVHREFRVA